MAQDAASTPSAAPTVAPASAPPTTAPSASVTPPSSSPASTSPSSSPPAPPTPLVEKPAGFTALPLLISVAPGVSAPPIVSPLPDLPPYWCSLRPFAVLVVIEPQYSVQIHFLGFKVFHSLRRGRSAAMKKNNGTFSFGNGNKVEERSDCCVLDSFGKSIVLDCFKIQNLLLGLKKCNTKGRYKIRAARFIKDSPVLMWYARDNMVHGRILLQRFLKDKLSNM
ncbi:hypothetical protein OROHE_006177 [Orobanche hederae]